MDIAALSMSLSSTKVEMGVGIAVAKKMMDQQQVQADGLMKLIEASIPQEVHAIDMKV